MPARTPAITLAATIVGLVGIAAATALNEPEPGAPAAAATLASAPQATAAAATPPAGRDVGATPTPSAANPPGSAPTTSVPTTSAAPAPETTTERPRPKRKPDLPGRAFYLGTIPEVGTLALALRPDGEAVAYLCGPAVESWLTGAVAGHLARLSGPGTRVSLTRAADTLEVTVWVGQRAYPVTLRTVKPAEPPTDAQVRAYALGRLP